MSIIKNEEVKTIIQDEHIKESMNRILEMNSKILDINIKLINLMTAVQITVKQGE